ncbi:MAG: DUF423 domain-containing protein [Flavobacteriaceae bacterium]|nr:DUF423 domain-containing protein [Flavobacteriaceae bacterium]
MNKAILVTAAILGLISVALGAFAAHGLENLVSSESIDSFQTGVRYQMYYAILLIIIGLSNYFSPKTKKTVYYLTLFGVILFSGSIYGLSTNDLSSFDFNSIALITPVGGLLLIGVWVILLISFLKKAPS